MGGRGWATMNFTNAGIRHLSGDFKRLNKPFEVAFFVQTLSEFNTSPAGAPFPNAAESSSGGRNPWVRVGQNQRQTH